MSQGFVKNTKNVVINTDNDKLEDCRNQKRQVLKEREVKQIISLIRQEIDQLKLELSEIKSILSREGKQN